MVRLHPRAPFFRLGKIPNFRHTRGHMIQTEIADGSKKISRQAILEIILFVFVFGLFIAIVSAIMAKYFNPSDSLIVRDLLLHKNRALELYFIYVIIASVIIPLPTLPVDVVLFNLLDPWSIITVRLLAGLAGGTISFLIARNYGRPLLKRWLSPKNYQFVERISGNITWKQFLFITMVPIVNTEVMAYAGGISKLKLRFTLFVLAIADFYRLAFVFFIIHAR